MKGREEFQLLVLYQFDVLGMKCDNKFMARQMNLAKNMLRKYSYEDLLNVMKFYKIVGIPRDYKSLYYLNRDTQYKIDMAKEYIKQVGMPIEEEVIKNEKVKKSLKFDL